MRAVLLLIGLFCIILSADLLAATRTGLVGGSLASPLTGTSAWDCGCIPTQNDDLVIPDGSNVSITGDFTVNNGSITLTGTSSLTIDGNVTFNNNSTVTVGASATLIINGNLLNRNNSSDINFNGTVDINGTLTNNGTGSVINVGANSTLEVDDFVNNSNGTVNFTEPVTLTVINTCTNNGDVNDTSGTYNGCAQGVLASSVLPITLGDFEGKICGRDVCLDWVTLSEENFEFFSIERSVNGFEFESIARVPGAGGDSEEARYYQWTDPNPLPGTSYYRLRSVDFDGYNEVFFAIAIFNDLESTLEVYPTHITTNKLNIESYEDHQGLEVKLIDMQGASHLIGRVGEDNAIELPLDVINGIYFLSISGIELSTKRIMINR